MKQTKIRTLPDTYAKNVSSNLRVSTMINKFIRFVKKKWNTVTPIRESQQKTNTQGTYFVRFLIALIVGILLGNFGKIYFVALPWIWVGIGIAYVVLWFAIPKAKKLTFAPLMGFLALFNIFTFGLILVHFRNESNLPHHILRQNIGFEFYRARVISEVLEKPKSYHFVCQIEQIRSDGTWIEATDKVNIFLEKGAKKPQFGDVFITKNKLQLINKPLNEAQFDYRKYLSYQNIYHQQYIQKKDFAWVGHKIAWYEHFELISIQIRQYCDESLAKTVQSEQEYGMASALVLGVKHHLDEDLKQAYTNAGVTHVLAVSGMHVGIIYMILVFLLGKIKRLPNGKLYFVSVVLLILWLYAFITGLSGSVLRAVMMFSMIVIAQNLQRNSNIFNTLAASLFFLLCWNPFLLMDVGLQLSYLAVLGIVYLFPKMYVVYQPTNYLTDWIWKTIVVSVAAQIFTLPITLYHFHQYPTYGILANLLIIPLGNVVLIIGLTLVAVASVPYISMWLGWLLEKVIWATNKIVFQVENLDYATTSFVIDLPEAVALSIFLLGTILFFEQKRFSWICVAVASFVWMNVSFVMKMMEQRNQSVFVVYGVGNAWACSLTEGRKSQLWTDSTLQNHIGRLNFNTKNLLDELGTKEKLYAKPPQWHDFQTWKLWVWRGKRIVFVQKSLKKLDYAKINVAKPHYLILQNNAVKKLDWLKHSPEKIIVDASNKSYIAEKLSSQHPLVHNIYEKGSFMLRNP
jgi:competence protein ComEC